MNADQQQHPGFKPGKGLALLAVAALAACGGGGGGGGSGSGSGSGSSGASGSSGSSSSSSGSGSSGSGSSGASSSGASSGSSSGGSAGDPAGGYLGILENPAAGSSDTMWGLIDARHQAVFVDQTAQAVYRSTSFIVAGDRFSGGYVSFTPSSSGGTSIVSGTAHSYFAARESLTGYLASSDAAVPAYSFSDSYQPALYGIPAAFATIAGTYSFSGSPPSGSLSIAADGSFTLSYTGCTAKGNFTIPDPAHNAYEMSGTQTCSSTTLAFTGLASYTPAGSVTKPQLTFEYDDGKSVAVQAAATQQ